MGFGDILKQRLGPMGALLGSSRPPIPKDVDPGRLFYRRAVGFEARVRLHAGPDEAELLRLDPAPTTIATVDEEEARLILGLTSWKSAGRIEEETGIGPKRLWQNVERELLYWAPEDPGRSLRGSIGALGTDGPIARRASMWPVLAVEGPTEIGPMPFMPRGRDLAGAQLVGARFSSLERGFEVLGASLLGRAEHGALLRRLLPLLDGRRTQEEIGEVLGSAPGLSRLLRWLDTLTVLEPTPTPRAASRRFTGVTASQLTWLGHAGVLVQTPRTNLLVDPLFFAASEPESPRIVETKPDPRDLPQIDAVFVTHGDNDHLNPGSLAHVDPRTPIYIPRAPADAPPWQVDLRGLLRVLGFETVVELSVGQKVEIGDLTVLAMPFHGESWGLELPKLTYRIDGEELSLYFGADAAGMDEVYRTLADSRRRIDVAFLGVSDCAEAMVMPPGLGYGNFYEPWIPAVDRARWVQHCDGPRAAARGAALFRPRFVFGYAAGGTSFYEPQYSDTGSHDDLARLLLAGGDEAPRPVAFPVGQPVRWSELASLQPFQRPRA